MPIPRRSELIELYRVAVDEYRFEVRLNWDRMQYYVVVNSGIIAVATGLLRDAKSAGIILLCGTMFVIGIAMTLIGMFAIHREREYYQQTVFKKALYEHLLGLDRKVPGQTNERATLAIGTTEGMRNPGEVLAGMPRTRFVARLFRHRVVSYFIWLLILLGTIDLAGGVYAVSRALEFKAEAANAVPKPSSVPSSIVESAPSEITQSTAPSLTPKQ